MSSPDVQPSASIEALRFAQLLLGRTPENPQADFSISPDGVVALGVELIAAMTALVLLRDGLADEGEQRRAIRASLDRRLLDVMAAAEDQPGG